MTGFSVIINVWQSCHFIGCAMTIYENKNFFRQVVERSFFDTFQSFYNAFSNRFVALSTSFRRSISTADRRLIEWFHREVFRERLDSAWSSVCSYIKNIIVFRAEGELVTYPPAERYGVIAERIVFERVMISSYWWWYLLMINIDE